MYAFMDAVKDVVTRGCSKTIAFHYKCTLQKKKKNLFHFCKYFVYLLSDLN